MDLQALAPSQQAVTSMATNESDPLKKKGEAILEATVQANSLKIDTKASSTVATEGKGLLQPSEKMASSLQANVSSMLDCVDENNGSSTTTTKTCSVKLVDISRPSIGASSQNSSDNSNSKIIGDAVKRDLPGLLSDEPNAKKARQSNPSESNRVLLKPKDFIDLKRRTVSSNSSNNHESPSRAGQIKQQPEETSTSTEASKTTSESAFDNVEEELGRLFGSSSPSSGNGRKDTKVTISPVRLSSFTSSSSTSSSSSSAKESVITSSSSSSSSTPSLATPASSGGSVTITKLSTGSTLNVESKDLKTVLSANSGGTQQQQSNNSSLSTSKAGNVETSGLKLKSNIDIVSLSASGGSSKLPPQLSPPCDGSSIKCNKCNEEYSTKEARRLHTCNSILDQHYLSVENTGERQANNTKTTSSPNSPHSSSGDPCTVPPASSSMSSPSSFDSASSRSNSPMTDQMATNNKKPSAKLIKEKSDKLIIEGRPKLSVTKVPRQTTEAIAGNCKPIVPKFKLSSAGGGGASNIDQCSLSNKANADNSANYSGKLKIKLQPEKPTPPSVDTTYSSTSRPNTEQSGPEGGLAFSFAGKPTYSPSRASEPSNGAVPTKGKDLQIISPKERKVSQMLVSLESPRDASNKDSPASQADSGVYSIASSSSPSKGDGAPTAESTSPESPNRDRMAYPEQNFNRDIQCKSKLSKSLRTIYEFLLFLGKSGQTQGIDPAVSAAAKSIPQQQQQQPSSQSTATGTSAIAGPRAHHTMASSGSRPTVTPSLPSPSVTHNASIVASQPMPRTGLSHDSFVKPDSTHLHHQQMYQQQQQLQQQQHQQQQQQSMGWPGADRAQYPPQMPGNPQEMMQSQYSYSQNFFGFEGADGEPPKRKRGRPRKNPLKEPTTTKRKYTRKKPMPPQSASAVNPMPNVNAQAGFNNGLKNVMAAAHGDPSAAAAAMQSAANMGNYDPSVSSSPSVYNFDDEEEGGVQPMRPRRANLEAKKYAFGSSSDEDGNNKAAMMQQAGYPPHPSRINEFQMQMQRPMMRQQQHMAPPNMMMMKNQQRMSMEMHHRMMSMQQQQQQQLQSQQFQQQHYQQQQQAPQQPQRPTQQQQQQQQQQQTQSAFNENQQGEEGLSYSSEVLTKPTGGIGIKIKIKKAADDKTPSKRSKREDEVPSQQQVGSQQQGPQSQVSQQQIPGPPQRQHHHPGAPNDGGMPSSKAKDLPSIQQNNPAAAARSSQFQSQVPPMQPMSSTTNTSVMQPSGSLSPAMNMMQQQQQQQLQQQQMHQQQPNSHGNIRPPNMFVGQQQQQSMQRTMQNSPLQSGHTTPSPIRSPYNNTSPSPQHPGFGGQQQMNMNQFNRFQQPNSAGMVPGSGMNNYGYGMAAPGNYRLQNPQFMDGSNNFYNNHYINGGFAANQGNRFGHPNGQPYYNQMQQGSYNNGFNSGGSFGSGNSTNDFSQQQSNEMYPNNFTAAAGGNAQPNRMLPPNDNNGGQPIPPHFRGNMSNMQHSPMGSPIGPPRISPSAMHKPMPGVGMPRASPIASSSVNNQAIRQHTPLVSPQSMHSDHSASSPMHNNPLTPSASSTTPGGLPHGGMTSPMYNTPRTPSSQQQQQQHLSMMSPSPRSAQVQSLEQSPIMASSEEMKSPCNMQMLKSPLPYTSSNLRKIRRPSKPSNMAEEASPIAATAAPNELPTSSSSSASSSNTFFNAVKAEPVAAAVKAEEVVKEEPEPVFEARWEELDVKLWKRIFRMCCENERSSVPFLVRAQRVCSKWKEAVTSDMSLWTHLDLSSGRGFKERYRNDKKLEWFLKKYPNVLELKLGMWKNSVSTSTIRVVAQYCPNLISLGLSGSFKLTNEDLKLIGDSFPKLQRIDLSGVSPSSSSSRSAVSSTCLTDFITVLGNRLTVLNISNNKMAGLPFVFKALSAHSVNLEVLDIANITTTSRDTININLEKFQKGCQKLRILNANQTMLSLTEAPVREQVNSPGFPNLEELHIAVDSRGYFDGMDDSQIERVLTKSAKLRVLDVRGCQHVSTSCLIRLKSWVIEKLVLAGCSATSDSSDSIEMLVQKFKCIADLDISLTTGERTVNNACSELADADEHKLR